MMTAQKTEFVKTLKFLLQDIVDVTDKDNCDVTGLSLNSNQIKPGNI